MALTAGFDVIIYLGHTGTKHQGLIPRKANLHHLFAQNSSNKSNGAFPFQHKRIDGDVLVNTIVVCGGGRRNMRLSDRSEGTKYGRLTGLQVVEERLCHLNGLLSGT